KQCLDASGALAEETVFTWDGAVLAEQATSRAEPGRQHRVSWDARPGSLSPLTQAETASLDDDTGERFYAVLTDQTGTPTELLGPDGTVAGYQQHTVWGGTLWPPGGASTPLRFPGQYHDPETGLDYSLHRYYDPVAGAYLSPDPRGPYPS